jgi:hypothetical protein
MTEESASVVEKYDWVVLPHWLPIPASLRFNPASEHRPTLSISKIVCLASVGFVGNVNAYTVQPQLIEIAKTFNVSNERIADGPTLIGAGCDCMSH